MAPREPPSFAGVTAKVERGGVVSSTTSLEERSITQIAGSTLDWLDTLVEPRDLRLHVTGELNLAIELLHALHTTLFGIPEL